MQPQKKTKVLITGAAGFIGSLFLSHLKDYDVIGITRKLNVNLHPNLIE